MVKSEQDEKPHNSTVREWMVRIRDGTIAKPRWQRGVVWDDEKIEQLFKALLDRRPVGALLTLDCAVESEKPIFEPVQLAHAPKPQSCKLLILDGQQRLTALWSVFNNVFSNGESGPAREFFVRVSENEGGDLEPNEVLCIKKNNKKVPGFSHSGVELISSPKIAWKENNIVPLRILAPHVKPNDYPKSPLVEWCDEVHPDANRSRTLERKLDDLARRLSERDISDYRLGLNTKREDAIDAFIKTNESSATISRFDIAVAEIEREILADEEIGLREKIRTIDIDELRKNRFFGSDEEKRISTIGELILKIACLLQERPPTDRSFTDKGVIKTVSDSWDQIVSGINDALEFFEQERIFDNPRLPSEVPLRVIPALLASEVHPSNAAPHDPDKEGISRSLIRSYLWRSFLTDRYDRQANQRLFEDYTDILADLERISTGNEPKRAARIFDDEKHPCLTKDDLTNLDKPKSPTTKNKQSRAIFACTLRDSAKDLATDEHLNVKNVNERQYHHLFPKALMLGARLSDCVDHPLNFVLVSGITNRKIAAKVPLNYLSQRIKDGMISPDELKQRVESHMVPFDALNVEKVSRPVFNKFIAARAEIVSEGISKLAQGLDWHP